MTVPLRTRVLIADDHQVVRRGLSMVLDAAPDLQVVAEASDGIEAVQRALEGDIDLAVLDVAMPRRTGLQAARELTRRRPELRVLMLSMHDVEAYCFEALRGGRRRLRAEDGRRPRSDRGVPRRNARSVVPLPADRPHADAVLSRRRRPPTGRAAEPS